MLFQTPPITFESKPAIIIKKAEEPKQQLYTIRELDTLTSISESQTSSVERLWQKNPQLTNPDQIKPGDVLTIPKDDETLTDRPLPAREMSVSIQAVTLPTQSTRNSPPSGGFSSSGNTYFAGQCVWYIKNIVPWVQNGWGNASDWKYTSGHRVSPVPAVGTVAWAKAYGHVALVTAVDATTVQIREMNYTRVGVESTRQAPITEFEYIYP